MLIIVFKVVWKDKNIINICYIKNVKKRAKYFVNLGLKSSKDVKKAKKHYKGFKKTIAGVKCRYLFLAFFYLNSVKHVNNVKLSIELG
jgi:hypothetical protein